MKDAIGELTLYITVKAPRAVRFDIELKTALGSVQAWEAENGVYIPARISVVSVACTQEEAKAVVERWKAVNGIGAEGVWKGEVEL